MGSGEWGVGNGEWGMGNGPAATGWKRKEGVAAEFFGKKRLHSLIGSATIKPNLKNQILMASGGLSVWWFGVWWECFMTANRAQ